MAEYAPDKPQEAGRRATAYLDATMRREWADCDFVLTFIANTHTARRHAQATNGNARDAMRTVFEAGDKLLEPPRLRLVNVEK